MDFISFNDPLSSSLPIISFLDFKSSVQKTNKLINPTMLQEEIALISFVNKSIGSSRNSAIIGQNGEIPLRNFLKRHLPNIFIVESGHFTDGHGNISPQVDILLLDSRFPVLARNSDGSVLAMGESVIACISIKSKIVKRDIDELIEWSKKIGFFSNKIYPSGWKEISLRGIGYVAGNYSEKIVDNFFEASKKMRKIDLMILRKIDKEQLLKKQPIGFYMWWEILKLEMIHPTCSPLSDFLYDLMQNAYEILDSRKIKFVDIHNALHNYFKWGTLKESQRKK